MLVLYQLNCQKILSHLVGRNSHDEVDGVDEETEDGEDGDTSAATTYILVCGCICPAPYLALWELSQAYTGSTWQKTHWTFGPGPAGERHREEVCREWNKR